jgi:hypothetical protein
VDEDMKAKKFRIQRDALRTMNVSIVLFLKLLIKTCDVVQSTSTSSAKGKRASNTLDVDHLVKAVKRYEVLAFMQDLLKEMNHKPSIPQELPSTEEGLDSIGSSLAKRKERIHSNDLLVDADSDIVYKKQKSCQISITSFFKPN